MEIKELKNETFYKEFRVQVPFTIVDLKVQERIIQAAKDFKLPGFREGKVPLSIVKQKIGKEETGRQIQEQVSNCIKELTTSKKIVPYSKPNIKILTFDKDNGLSVEIGLPVFGTVPDIKWTDIEIEKIRIKISDQELEQTKNQLFQEFRKFKSPSKDYNARLGDKVTLNFYGNINGKDFDGNEADNMELIIGNNTFLASFEDKLLGCKIDEERSFKIVFPHDYPKKEIANKEAEFKVTITNLQELETIQVVSNEMLQKVGVESEEKLNEVIKQKLHVDCMSALRLKMKKDIFDIIDDQYRFDLPEEVVEQDFKVVWSEAQKDQNKIKASDNKSEKEMRVEYHKIAERRVRLGVIMNQVINDNNITITDTELIKIVELHAKQNPEMKDKISSFYKDKDNLAKIRGPILEEKALDYILEKVKFKDKEMTMSDFTNKILPTIKS